ncbi:MAG: hypothetical protein H6Q73_3947 [Firmicutes bacterium]|nr:hypothetical protein [Bacillota bacterium]
MGPKLLKRYLEYAFSIATKERASALQVLKAVNPVLNVAASSENISFDSPFEEEVYRALRQQGYDVRTQVGCSGYRIDLAVVDPSDPTRFILGIECDGAMFHSAKSARERDIYRQRFLESKGWKISRIWSKNWWQDPIREIEKIQTVIKSLTNQIAS